MKLKISKDANDSKSVLLDGIEVNSITKDIKLYINLYSSEVQLTLIPSDIEVEIDSEVQLVIEDGKYHLESINKN